jgi:hypothetical protein
MTIGRMQEIIDKIFFVHRETIRLGQGLTSFDATKLCVALEDIACMLEQDSLVFQEYLDKVNNDNNHVDDDYVPSDLSSPPLLKHISMKTVISPSTSKTCRMLNMTQIRCHPLVTMSSKLVNHVLWFSKATYMRSRLLFRLFVATFQGV